MSKFFPMLAAIVFASVLPRAAAQNTGITGHWHFVFQTEGGERTANPTFQLEGKNVTGKWDKADVKGTFSDGRLDLSFPYNSEEGGPGTLKIKGELKGDTLTGTWEFQEYTGSFKATRGDGASRTS
jgi:hypothetical protein